MLYIVCFVGKVLMLQYTVQFYTYLISIYFFNRELSILSEFSNHDVNVGCTINEYTSNKILINLQKIKLIKKYFKKEKKINRNLLYEMLEQTTNKLVFK